jgi:hypothetical protein
MHERVRSTTGHDVRTAGRPAFFRGNDYIPRGDKNKYTAKQERKAEHIEEGYRKKGVSKKEAESRAWATVNKQDGGGKNPGGSGRKTSSKKRSKD